MSRPAAAARRLALVPLADAPAAGRTSASRSIRSGVATAAAVAAVATLAGCLGSEPGPSDDEPTEPTEATAVIDSELVGSHVYARPPLPTARYDAPTTNVVFVAPGGDDARGTGSSVAPYATLRKALQVVNAQPPGPTWTIVLRAGVYREGELDVTRNNVTIQRFGTEAVSLYGSVAVTGFAGSGPFTRTINMIDPTYLEQDCADTHLHGSAGRDFGSETAIAVIRAGIPLRRVATGTVPGTGQYAYDPASNVLTVRDSPQQIELATRQWAIRSKASGVKLAGLDIEGYATCVVDWKKTVAGRDYFKAAVLFFKDTPAESNALLENSTVANNAASAVAIANGHGVRLTGNTIVNNGGNGIHGGNANNLVIANNRISFNNVRRWANTTEAGIKITNIQNGVVFGNVIEHNAANGFWCDQRCGATNPASNWFIVARNLVRHNDNRGLFYEVSHHGVIASNVVHDNGSAGIAAFGSRNVRIWNNTAVDNNASTQGFLANVSVVDDRRCAAGDTVPGGAACTTANQLDPQPVGDSDRCEPSSGGALANTCNAEGISIANNIISGSAGTRPLLNIEDGNHTLYGARRIVVAEDFQAYWRPSRTVPTTLIDWETTAGAPAVAYPTLAAMAAATGFETHAVERTGGATHPFFVDYTAKNLVQNPASTDVVGRGAALPLEVLKAVFWPATAPGQPSARIGAIEWAQKPAP